MLVNKHQTTKQLSQHFPLVFSEQSCVGLGNFQANLPFYITVRDVSGCRIKFEIAPATVPQQ